MPFLKPCPEKSNCVSSRDAGRSSFIEPLHFSGEAQAATVRLIKVIMALPRTELVRDEGDYLQINVSSWIFGFVDEVEFLLDDKQKIIHVRSAARKGSYDFGVNRRRVEVIRRDFMEDR